MGKKSRIRSGASTNQLRIIGGRWRSRVLRFPSVDGLRPTPDRVRETLFNWLRNDLPGARCLDLFSGSGALALEALSRGASFACLIDSAPEVSAQLETNLRLLDCPDAMVCHARALDWIAHQPPETDPFDIVFLDPPFASDLLERVIAALTASPLLAPDALIYAESSATTSAPLVPPDWTLWREKKTGGVVSQLFRRGNITEI